MLAELKKILSDNLELTKVREKSISFDKDFEGKRLLNFEITKLYKKNPIVTEEQFIHSVIDSDIIINKMNKMPNCGWDLSDLKSQLESGISNYLLKKENSFDIKQSSYLDKSKLINATTIGKYFDVSSQRINLILSELGWIEKNVAGWEVTKLGKSIGGRRKEHETSGGFYVLWPETILQNKSLLEVFKEPTVDHASEGIVTSDPFLQSVVKHPTQQNSFREKFDAKHRAIDGHIVRSKSEMLIDNWLYQYGIIHAYERKLPIEEDFYCDFYIPSGNGRPQGVYIEYWGIENDPKYEARKKKKKEIYQREGFSLIELTDIDIQNIDDILPKKLLQNKIKVG